MNQRTVGHASALDEMTVSGLAYKYKIASAYLDVDAMPVLGMKDVKPAGRGVPEHLTGSRVDLRESHPRIGESGMRCYKDGSVWDVMNGRGVVRVNRDRRICTPHLSAVSIQKGRSGFGCDDKGRATRTELRSRGDRRFGCGYDNYVPARCDLPRRMHRLAMESESQ